jgi:hypothetical protein
MDKAKAAVEIQDMEVLIREIERRTEGLKLQYILFFNGELDVPPEKERGDLEKFVRNAQYSSLRSPRLGLLLQNAVSRFTLFNNMWLKKLNEIESGLVTIQKKRVASPGPEPKTQQVEKVFGLSLNNEVSFENFYEKYCELNAGGALPGKDSFINSLKTKMISSNLVDAKAAISVEMGKPRIKIKK